MFSVLFLNQLTYLQFIIVGKYQITYSAEVKKQAPLSAHTTLHHTLMTIMTRTILVITLITRTILVIIS